MIEPLHRSISQNSILDDLQDSQFDTVQKKSSKRGLLNSGKSSGKFSSNLDVMPISRRKKVKSPLDQLPELNKDSRSEKSAEKASFNRPKMTNPVLE